MNSPVWQPPENPDPFAILRSARKDTRDRSFDRALAKFLWFHKYALQYNAALVGVRLSFALSYWMKLAAIYQPAREAFIRERNETEARLLTTPFDFELFEEFAAFNQRLGEGHRTAALFMSFSQQDSTRAHRIYPLAESELIAIRRFDICSPFLNPRVRVAAAARRYILESRFEESMKNLATMESEVIVPQCARNGFANDVGTLVALLVLNGRMEDAEFARETALFIMDDNEFRAVLDAADTGQFPKSEFDGEL